MRDVEADAQAAPLPGTLSVSWSIRQLGFFFPHILISRDSTYIIVQKIVQQGTASNRAISRG